MESLPDRNEWYTLGDMERVRRQNAIRRVSTHSVKKTSQGALLKIAELNEQIYVDVDVSHLHAVHTQSVHFPALQFHASLWLSADEVTVLDSGMELDC
jgi:hypothetical protein